MPRNITTREALNSQCLLQILIWFTLNVISVLKPYTLIKIFYGLPTTAWPAFNYG